MNDDTAFEQLEEAVRTGGAPAAWELLANKFRAEKNYPLLFEALLMQKRHELGLPLIQSGQIEDVPAGKRVAYEKALMDVAREVGGLFLADGEIERAWPYFRAIGLVAPIADAIEKIEPRENLDGIIQIAFQEQVNPRKAFELVLEHHGICRAISFFEQYPDRNSRDACLRLLVRTLHRELRESVESAISRRKGDTPETSSIPELIAGRDWLFGEYDYYVDTSHLVSIIRFALELTDHETLRLAVELTEYGKRLSASFHFRGEPPFENIYEDHAFYLRALVGEEVEAGIDHFRRKVRDSDPELDATVPVQVLVTLLARLHRYNDAIAVAREHLRDVEPARLGCPSLPQLCQMAGDFQTLRELSRNEADLLGFAAGLVASGSSAQDSGAPSSFP